MNKKILIVIALFSLSAIVFVSNVSKVENKIIKHNIKKEISKTTIKEKITKKEAIKKRIEFANSNIENELNLLPMNNQKIIKTTPKEKVKKIEIKKKEEINEDLQLLK